MTALTLADLGRYDCPACPARFRTVGEKKRHLREAHTEDGAR